MSLIFLTQDYVQDLKIGELSNKNTFTFYVKTQWDKSIMLIYAKNKLIHGILLSRVSAVDCGIKALNFKPEIYLNKAKT